MERYRIHQDESVYVVTFSVVDWLPVCISEATCSIVTESVRYCQQHFGLCVNGYVIMPTHLHAILFNIDHDSTRLSVTAMRKFTGRRLLEYAEEHLPRVFNETFRKAADTDRARRFWQPSRHPVALSNRELWSQKLDYIHDNPRRKGLVRYPEHWRYSSARYYAEGTGDLGDVTITELEW